MQTDNKPLTSILGPKFELPALAAARLQRWAITLSTYNYELELRPTQEHGNADGLLRLPMEHEEPLESISSEASLFNTQQLEVLPILPDPLQRETSRDVIILKVFCCEMEGWPEKVIPELHP